MNQEFGKKIFERQLAEQTKRKLIPTREDDEGYTSLLIHRLEVNVPEIEEILRKRAERENEEIRKAAEARFRWIEESNTVPGVFDNWHKIHIIMNKRPPIRMGAPHPIDELVEQEKRDYLKVNPKKTKPGWGRYGNLTREQLQPSVDRAVEQDINRKFETARLQDLKNIANGTYFDKFENEDTQP